MNKFSKYEIFEAAVKATKDKNLTLKDVEVQLKKLGFSTSEKEFSNATRLAVVARFKLEKAKKQSDKQLIASLEKRSSRFAKAIGQSISVGCCSEKINDKINDLLEAVSNLNEQVEELKTEKMSRMLQLIPMIIPKIQMMRYLQQRILLLIALKFQIELIPITIRISKVIMRKQILNIPMIVMEMTNK